MIRTALESDFSTLPGDECAVRIHSLKCAYGLDAPFIRYYADECGGLLSVMDGAGVLYCVDNVEEWLVFITMNPDIFHVHCPAVIGRQLIALGGWQGREGVVLKYDGPQDPPSSSSVCENPYLPHVHALLDQCFESMASLNAWYPDVSHRIRHNCAKIAVILDGEQVVSTAMTVAETDTAAVLGQVATHSDYRGRGYAKTCINSLISRCKDKTLYILPMTDIAHSLYVKMGFVPDGEWAELQRV